MKNKLKNFGCCGGPSVPCEETESDEAKSREVIKKTVKEQYSSLVKDDEVMEKMKKKGKAQWAKMIGYKDNDLKEIPDDAVDYAFGCGNPLSYAQVKEGDVVLDLGSGAGIDVLLASKKVGERGKVIGLDMTQEMIEKAKANAERAGVKNVEFCLGDIENIPKEDKSVDWIISNCVINLSPDKKKVFREAFRVLKPGGKILISDLVVEEIPEEVKNNLLAWAGCIAGAMDEKSYLDIIRKAGFKNVKVVGRFIFKSDTIKGLMADCRVEVPDSLNEIYAKYKKEIDGKISSIKVLAEKPPVNL